ncbi:hypothetical protein R2601_12700 [Salipiger bermudensis HTCC2601]|uniref:Uncharacterized protein n=1 Tax=Salipiger bermudensis (strain DSM 26914 / JCM 13377 / KCTC 12554 / HTCC2601) TaxID=314265 RepID=Q0FJZ0_SALBH|nr:hypothetical protein R2601_12700 [Salipiger bermudensis HTCC2601]
MIRTRPAMASIVAGHTDTDPSGGGPFAA